MVAVIWGYLMSLVLVLTPMQHIPVNHGRHLRLTAGAIPIGMPITRHIQDILTRIVEQPIGPACTPSCFRDRPMRDFRNSHSLTLVLRWVRNMLVPVMYRQGKHLATCRRITEQTAKTGDTATVAAAAAVVLSAPNHTLMVFIGHKDASQSTWKTFCIHLADPPSTVDSYLVIYA